MSAAVYVRVGRVLMHTQVQAMGIYGKSVLGRSTKSIKGEGAC